MISIDSRTRYLVDEGALSEEHGWIGGNTEKYHIEVRKSEGDHRY